MMKFFRSDNTVYETRERQDVSLDVPAQETPTSEAAAHEAPLQPVEAASEPAPAESIAPELESDAAHPVPSTGEHDFESDLRDVVRRDVVRWRRSDHGRITTDNVSTLVQRVAGQSVREIDNVIDELQAVRDALRTEGERLRRDLNSYASMNQSAMASMKIIGESMSQWRSTLGNLRRREHA
jgi:hypothetical protein